MSSVGRIVLRVAAIGVIVAAVAVYAGLVWDGTLPPPDVRSLAQQVTPVAQGTLGFALGAGLVFIICCAALAPIIYAARSGDILTVLVSLVLTTAAIAALVSSRTVFDMVLGALVYLANLTLSAIVYAAHYIAQSRAGPIPVSRQDSVRDLHSF
jgi:Na+/H+-dicarboxylate symporter